MMYNMSMKKVSMKKRSPGLAPAALIVFFYLLLRFVLIRHIDALGHYASYIFEVLFVAVVLTYYRKRVRIVVPNLKSLLLDGFIALPVGYAVFKFASLRGIEVPFDLTDKETLLFLLLLAPLLEELIFRQALWLPTETLVVRPVAVIGLTSVLFAFAHFHAWFFVDPAIQAFVLYQAVYTLLVGIWWGYRFSRTRNLAVPMLLHWLFNLGFYLGFAY